MTNSFFIRISPTALAVLDTVDYYGEGRYITRISVPRQHEGRGYGRQLLKMALADADYNCYRLWLEIKSSGGMTYDQLDAWYRRYGFKHIGGGMYRRKFV